MLFNSLHFLLFFPVFCYLYFAVPRRFQHMVLAAGGYYFYGSFSPYFTIILLTITCNDFILKIINSITRISGYFSCTYDLNNFVSWGAYIVEFYCSNTN